VNFRRNDVPLPISVNQLADSLRNGSPVYLIDVRQPWEHAIASLPDSILIPLPDLPSRLDEIQPPAGASLICYCHHGVRSWQAALLLEAKGFIRVGSLSGGIDAWSRLIDPTVPRY
jgi:rhodanese-related sulfurtransferase